MFIMYTFVGEVHVGEYGEGNTFYERNQMNSGWFFSYFQCGELTFVLTLKEKAAAAAVKWDIFCPNKGRELHKKDHLRSVR